ncbi:hypothetical protein [Marinobacterium sp. BA1]|uniref:hypothetical protein n=1 Tax=Marinobacterium sp. BA1 TaxID=3138931 RepID=UPI0032E6BFD3
MTDSKFHQVLQSNSSSLSRIETMRKAPITNTGRNLVFGGLALGSIVGVGIIAFQIIAGVAALAFAAVTCTGLYFGLKYLKAMDPVIKQKLKNHQIKSMVEEARKNAVAQLDSIVLDNEQKLASARAARDRMGASIEQLRSMLDPTNAGKPAYEQKLKMLERIEKAYVVVLENMDKAAVSHKAFKEKVREFKDLERFSVMAAETLSLIKGTEQSDLEEMLSLASFQQIETDFSESIISIENYARDLVVDAKGI